MSGKRTNSIKFSIRVKLILLIVVLLSISITSLGITSYNIAKKEMTDQFINSSEMIGNKLNQGLDEFLTSNEQNLEMLSNNFNVTDILSMPPEEYMYLNNALQNYQEAHPDIQTVYLGTHTKQMFLYPAVGLPADFDPTSRPWYQEAVKAGKMIWTEPYVDVGTGNVVVTVAKAVKDSKGELTGVVGADISLDSFMKMIQDTKLGKEGYFFVTDLKGNVVYHKDSSLINKPIPVKELMDAATKAQEDVIRYKYNGDKKVALIDPNKRLDWIIIGSFSEAEINHSAGSIIQATIIYGLVIGIIAIIVGILASTFMITKSLSMLVKDIQAIGSGNFKVRSRVKSKDEIGELSSTINHMVDQLSTMMKNVMNISSSVAASSDSLAATAQQTNASTEEVVRAIGEVTEAANDQARGTDIGLQKTTELADGIQMVAQSIDTMASKFSEASDLNKKGIDTVKLLTEKTEENNKAAEAVGKVIIEVDGSTKKIGAIIGTIGQIASQTNLLALNASIEAARAGDAGRGFAVVADEIRKLAEQSSQAAEQISALIQDIQEQSKVAVETMEGTRNITVYQNLAVKETEDVFKQISEGIENISSVLTNINSHNDNMLKGKNEITAVMENIASASQQTAASTEEISASTEEQLAIVAEISRTAEDLNTLAQKLNSEIKKFEI